MRNSHRPRISQFRLKNLRNFRRVSSSPPSIPGFLGERVTAADREKFEKTLETVKREGAIISTHKTPDADAFGAAFALWQFIRLRGLMSQIDIAVSNRIHLTDKLVKELEIPCKDWDCFAISDRRPLILVDVGSADQFQRQGGDLLLIIDHHPIGDLSLKARFTIANENAASASEMVASLIPLDNLDSYMALALAAGIVGDTEKLVRADAETIGIFSRLLEISGTTKTKIDELAFPPPDPWTVRLMLREFGNVRTAIHGKHLIAVAPTNLRIPAIAASAMRDIGVCIAAALRSENDGLAHRISIRVKPELVDAGLDAGRIARKTAALCLGGGRNVGGGHRGMAGGSLTGSYEMLSELLIEIIKNELDRVMEK